MSERRSSTVSPVVEHPCGNDIVFLHFLLFIHTPRATTTPQTKAYSGIEQRLLMQECAFLVSHWKFVHLGELGNPPLQLQNRKSQYKENHEYLESGTI